MPQLLNTPGPTLFIVEQRTSDDEVLPEVWEQVGSYSGMLPAIAAVEAEPEGKWRICCWQVYKTTA